MCSVVALCTVVSGSIRLFVPLIVILVLTETCPTLGMNREYITKASLLHACTSAVSLFYEEKQTNLRLAASPV